MMLGQIAGVPILDYHRMVAAGASALNGDRGAVHESAFRDQLQLLRDLKMIRCRARRHCSRASYRLNRWHSLSTTGTPRITRLPSA